MVDNASGNIVSISNLTIVDYDITNVKITQNSDGTWDVHFTFTYTVEYDLEILSDWQAGDTYTDKNGCTWEYQEDGSWQDTGLRQHDIDDSNDKGIKPDIKPGNGGTIITGKDVSVVAEKYDMSTKDFLKMFQAGQDIVVSYNK